VRPVTPCPAEDVLVQFAEGRLDASSRAAIDTHVDACRSCRLIVAGLTSKGGATSTAGLDSKLATPGSGERHHAGDRLTTGKTLGRYQVGGFLGAGAMGEVYLATDPALGRRVALKVLRVAEGKDSPELRARLVREAQVMGRLSHPNVVGVYEVGDEAGQVFIAMEFVDGESLRRWVAEPREWRSVLRVYLEAGKGLAAAHARGLVHRDFKPDNVLVDTEGRVRVSDFGLAADIDDAFTNSTAKLEGSVSVRLTQSGALVGTPAYMSPEMLQRRSTSAASDQFAFCVAVVEGLTGIRPMDGETLPALMRARLAGPVLKERSEVPSAVWRALKRGLEVEPARRFTSMDELLDVLTRTLEPRRRWPLVAAAAVTVGALSIAGVMWRQRSPSCEVPASALTGVWDDAQRARVQQAMLASTVPFAKTTAARVRQALEAHATQWALARRTACEATWVERTQSERLLDLRMRCLDRAKDELGAVAAFFAQADEATMTSATSVLSSLRPLEWCADERLLSSAVAPPTPAQSAAVTSVREALARTQVLIAARPKAAVDTLASLAAQAKTTGYAPVHAEVLADLAEAHLANSDAKQAETSAREAITVADAVADDVDRAKALLTLIDAVGPEQARWSEGTALVKDARAVVTRLGNDPGLESLLELRQGKLHYTQSQYAEALPHYERALRLREAQLGKDDARVAEVLQLLAICTGSLGKLDAAKVLYERTLRIREAALGPEHPEVAATLNTLGIDASDRGDFDGALALYQRALDIRVKALGPTHSRVGHVLTNMAGVYLSKGDAERAVTTIEQSIEVEATSMGAEHPSLAEPWSLACEAHATLGHEKESIAACERALAITLKTRAPTHVRVGLVQLSWGEALLKLGKPAEALTHLKEARAPIAARVGPGDMYALQLEAAEAEGLLAMKRPRDGLANVARALEGMKANEPVSPEIIGRVLVAAAQTTWAAGKKADAEPLTQRALEYLRSRQTLTKAKTSFEAWVANRG
jgi:tetratricopeptide (TPR) repeat protein/predicted Ser/Thr protein kinase